MTKQVRGKRGQKATAGGPSRRPPVGDGGDDGILIWGIHAVGDVVAHSPEQVLQILVLKTTASARLAGLVSRANDRGLTVRTVPADQQAAFRGKAHQGIAARIKPFKTVALDAVLDMVKNTAAPPFILALDSIQDPHNLGSLIRTAAAAGVSALLLPKDRSATLTGTVHKVAVGAAGRVPLCRVTNLVNALARLQEAGVWVYGTAAGATESIYSVDWTGPVCAVIGGEAKGIRPLVARQSDGMVSIPIQKMESLNAAVAGAVVLFEAVRQRWLKGKSPFKP